MSDSNRPPATDQVPVEMPSDRPPSQRPTSIYPAPASIEASAQGDQANQPAAEPASDASSASAPSNKEEKEESVQKPSKFKIGFAIAAVLAIVAFIVWAAMFNKSSSASPAPFLLTCGKISFPDCQEVSFEQFRVQNSVYTGGPKLDCRGKVTVLKRDDKPFGFNVCKCECKE